jgi:uncharacterized beta-barrel protein YwiB (DUF1934 family)
MQTTQMNQETDLPNAMITIEGRQWGTDDEEPQTMRLTTEGQLFQKDNAWHVVYDESEATGMAGTRTSLVIEADGTVTLDRSGSLEMRLVFIRGSHHVTQMQTPYGELEVGIYTHRVETQLNDRGGRISLAYSIDFNKHETSNTKLDLEVRRTG